MKKIVFVFLCFYLAFLESFEFTLVDLGLTKEEKEAIEGLALAELQGFSQYDRFGKLEGLEGELVKFFEAFGSHVGGAAEKSAHVIRRTVDFVLEATGKKSAWVCVRIFRKTSSFDQPRWHTDGRYFGFADLSDQKPCIKFAATLKGPGTLFYPASLEEREEFCAHRNDRSFLAKFLDPRKAIQTLPGEGAFFLVADPSNSAIHSEPPITEDRLFFSILPGSNEEIEELFNRWH